jgi:hypothetical protein
MMKRVAGLVVAGLVMAGCGESATAPASSSSIVPGAGIGFTAVPVESCKNGDNCTLSTPVVSHSVSGSTVTVSWAAVAGAKHYTTNCEAVSAGTSCVSGGGSVDGTSETFTVAGAGVYHFSVKAHGKGDNSLTGWAGAADNEIDIMVGDVTPVAPEKEHVHVDVACPTEPLTYNGAAQTPCSASVTGDKGLNQSLPVTYENNVNAGTATASASYTGDATHDGDSRSAEFTIGRAPVTMTAGGYTASYDGQSHSIAACEVSANFDNLTCANDVSTVGPDVTSGTVTPSESGAGWSNYASTAATTAYAITKAGISVTAGGYAGTYDGLTHAVGACSISGGYTGDLVCANSITTAGPNAVDGLAVTASVSSPSNVSLDNYDVTAHDGSIDIAKAGLTATAYNGARTFGQANPTSCTVTGAVNGESYSCTSSSTAVAASLVGSGPHAVVATMDANAGLSNYTVTYVGGQLGILAYDMSNCYVAPIYSSMPSTKAYQKKGSVLPIKCVIRDNFGAIISNASGTVTIKDRGTNALAAITGAFKFTAGTPPLYMNQQDTTNPYYVVGHVYDADTKWNDGSTTKGYFGIGK